MSQSQNMVVIRTLAEMESLKAYLEDKQFIAFDCETTGVVKGSEVIGFSVCADPEVGYYVVLAEWDVKTQSLRYLETREGAKSFLESLHSKSLVPHNGGFDCSMVENNYGVSLIGSVHTDTMLLAHLLDENRRVGLKELGTAIFGESATKEQAEMKASVAANGGQLTKDAYELYKADSELIARYGAKDAILTLNLFYHLVPELYAQGLDKFFYEDETMPLMRGPTYEMNNTGLMVDKAALSKLKATLETDCLEAEAFILKEIKEHIQDKYPGTNKKNQFNISSSSQVAWLLFIKLGQEFNTLTDTGKEVCKALGLKLPYSFAAKRDFIRTCEQSLGQEYEPGAFNPKTGKTTKGKKVREPQYYMACDKEALKKHAKKYRWVEKLLEHAKNTKLLNTYVEGIEQRVKYNIIRPDFLQHGTTSGRYSCRNPNFQNLPRDDKRVKACIVSRPGKVFVGADYSQLEPRVFASFSKDTRLLECFKNGDDFYSVVGTETFDKYDCTLKKDDENSFAKKYPQLRNISKVVALSATYGTTAPKMAPAIGKTREEAQEVIDAYFERFPSVKKFMTECHVQAMTTGQVLSYFNRPRRIPKALEIRKIYGDIEHSEVAYEYRNLLNLAVNHTIQSTAASIMNRAAIQFNAEAKSWASLEPIWKEVKIIMSVHDEIIIECPQELAEEVSSLLKDCMENTVKLPGVDMLAEPKIAHNLADLK